MIPAAELYRGNFDAYSRLFIEIPLPVTTAGLHRQPGGTYLRAFCKGPWDVLPERYREILDFAEERGLVLSGFSYEMGINESVIDRIEDYIVQIEIPVQPRQTT